MSHLFSVDVVLVFNVFNELVLDGMTKIGAEGGSETSLPLISDI